MSEPDATSRGDDLEAVLAHGGDDRDRRVADAYDAVADAYADALADELEHKPFDRWLVERMAALAGGGPVADAGCGPGHITAALRAAGADAHGFDFSPGMVREARDRFPGVPFAQANIRALPAPGAGAWRAILAWYSMVHMAPSELPGVMRALHDSLAPGGWLGFALHLGPEVRHLAAWWDRPVDVEFVLHREGEVMHAVTSADLELCESYIRSPAPEVEVATRRLYVLARRLEG